MQIGNCKLEIGSSRRFGFFTCYRSKLWSDPTGKGLRRELVVSAWEEVNPVRRKPLCAGMGTEGRRD